MNTIEFLEATKELINTPEKWIKGRSFVYNYNAGCTSYCISGAVALGPAGLLAKHTSLKWIAERQLENAVKQHGYTNIALFNDDPRTTHADVMNLFDEVITKIKKE